MNISNFRFRLPLAIAQWMNEWININKILCEYVNKWSSAFSLSLHQMLFLNRIKLKSINFCVFFFIAHHDLDAWNAELIWNIFWRINACVCARVWKFYLHSTYDQKTIRRFNQNVPKYKKGKRWRMPKDKTKISLYIPSLPKRLHNFENNNPMLMMCGVFFCCCCFCLPLFNNQVELLIECSTRGITCNRCACWQLDNWK